MMFFFVFYYLNNWHRFGRWTVCKNSAVTEQKSKIREDFFSN